MFDALVVTHAQEHYRDLLREAEKERLARRVALLPDLARIVIGLGLLYACLAGA